MSNQHAEQQDHVRIHAPEMLAMLEELRTYIAKMDEMGIETVIIPATVLRRMDALIEHVKGEA